MPETVRPFLSLKTMNYQSSIPEVEISGIIFEYVYDRSLRDLPIPTVRGIFPGMLFCFTAHRPGSVEIGSDWVYAIATKVSPYTSSRGHNFHGQLSHVYFNVVTDIASVVIA